jgi:hypothetical protein
VPFIATVVTSCTQRKSMRVSVDFAQVGSVTGVRALADAWRRLLDNEPAAGRAAALYQGRSVADAAAVASRLSSPWYVVSAGVGLVSADQPIPAYECTVAERTELSTRLGRLGATPSEWWAALTAHHPYPLSRLIAQGPTLLALPGSYLRMVHDDLCQVAPAHAEDLRIFTSTAGAATVPACLAASVMPYDDRLESVPGLSGTRADFAQRALRHFVETLDAVGLSRNEARSRVASSLERQPRPVRSPGLRMSDDDIRRTLREQWNRYEGRSVRLLRYLRDEAGISCEQKRFAEIWRSLAAELRP